MDMASITKIFQKQNFWCGSSENFNKTREFPYAKFEYDNLLEFLKKSTKI